MKSKLKFQYNVCNYWLYLILIPFMCPRGFMEYSSSYKLFFTVWLYIGLILIFFLVIYKFIKQENRFKKCILFMVLYYIIFIAITFMLQKGISQGFQKLFAAPALCLFCAICLKNKAHNFIQCLSKIIIVNFILNCTFFHPIIWSDYFNVNSHIIFLGHVQIVSQVSILAIFLSCLLYEYGEERSAKCLFFLTIINMIMSKTSASYIILGVVLIGFILLRMKSRKHIHNCSKIILEYFVVLNLILAFVIKNYTTGVINRLLNSLTSGRPFIWRKALELMEHHWILGYGAYGILIKVFWSKWSTNSNGMNYAHNELLQRLLDGGLILLVLFLIMLTSYVHYINKIENYRMQFWAQICLLSILIIMLFESVTEYMYFFILLSLFAFLPEILNKCEGDDKSHGNYLKNKI